MTTGLRWRILILQVGLIGILGFCAGFLLWGSVPEPLTIRRAVRALPAGHCVLVQDGRIGDPAPIGSPEVTAMEPAPAGAKTTRRISSTSAALSGASPAVSIALA